MIKVEVAEPAVYEMPIIEKESDAPIVRQYRPGKTRRIKPEKTPKIRDRKWRKSEDKTEGE